MRRFPGRERRFLLPGRLAVDDFLEIAGKRFTSRLMMGTGKWRTAEEMNAAFRAGRTEIITVAIRRLDLDDPSKRTLLDEIDWTKYTVLPNTAGCSTAEEALRVARLGRAVTGSDWVKLEVIGDPKYLLPDMDGTLEAARLLVKDGFVVLPYVTDDPILARKLQDIGTATIMPLGSPIGSGQGIPHFERIKIIIEQARVPVVVDAGLGSPSDAAVAMELGADAVLVNTAIARASDPVLMAEAFAHGVAAGRKGFLAGRIPRLPFAEASSPLQGVVR
jgi:thiazole synthase